MTRLAADVRRTLPRLFVGILIGLGIGSAGVHVWTHRFRFRALATETWAPRETGRYAGSQSCRECHARFYKLWAPSHHGKAMQPATAELFREKLTPLQAPIELGGVRWGVDSERLQMVEHAGEGARKYGIVHAMGGKNVYFFLTPLERGRLQVLPLSYDVRRKEWFNTTQAMVRHFSDEEDEAVDWRDPLLTFNTACYNCHVSQLDKNYDPATDTYHTRWREPGINCEACHGPGDEHARVCRTVPKGTAPRSMRIVRWKDFTGAQSNDACAPCHAKARPVKAGFAPGERFFDHYDLTCLEDRDFYPDGRDLGENYTQTAWLMNPCAQSGALNCVHCHTSSGRFRFAESPNRACLPCHAGKARDVPAHTHHPGKDHSPGCIDCHMPMTEFGRMVRSDHSMRPPSPVAGARFGSPVACILCHAEQTPEWAADRVHEWHPDSAWQPRILQEGTLLQAARKREWRRLPAMLAYLAADDSDPVVMTSLLRLLAACPDASKWDAIRDTIRHAHPLVRGAAAYALREDSATRASLALLLQALHDELRLVRVQAAAALTRLPGDRVPADHRQALADATADLLASFEAVPDSWTSHYNLGNYYSDRGETETALQSFHRAIALRKDIVAPYVNASVAASRLGRIQESVTLLKSAHAIEPDHGAVNLNLGLALAEQRDPAGAARHLRLALEGRETMPQAAYNLAVLEAEQKPAEAIRLCAMAAAAAPGNPRYAYTHAFYLDAAGRTEDAIAALDALVARHRAYADAWVLLGRIYVKAGRHAKATSHFQTMERAAFLPAPIRHAAREELLRLQREVRPAGAAGR